MNLQSKTALVTGASGGIGRALVDSFLAAGANVVGSDLCEGEKNEHANFHFVQSDVSQAEDVEKLIEQTIEHFGTLDILVNNAAVLTPTESVEKTSLEEFDKLIAVNLRGVFLLCKAAYPHLKKSKGCLLNISSMAGVHGEKQHAIYSATKGALNALTQSMAVDWGDDGLRCNALCPSSVLTPNVDKLIEALPNASEIINLRKSINALGFTATPQHIADAAVFLCSPQAAFMTGAIVPVSGGSECGYGIKY